MKREETILLKDLSDGFKRSKSTHQATILREIPKIGWKLASIVGTYHATLTPYEYFEQVTIQVEPLVQAVYEDNIERVKELCLEPSTDFLCTTQGLVDAREHATILDIAVERKASRCLTFFKQILELQKPQITLEKITCYTIHKGNFAETAQQHIPHVDIQARADSGELMYLYPKIRNTVSVLYDRSRQSAYNLAKQSGDMTTARLLLPIKKDKK
jgi:hypothetical protein